MRGIDATLLGYPPDALLLPTDVSSTPAATAEYPIVIVPLCLGFPQDTLLKDVPHRLARVGQTSHLGSRSSGRRSESSGWCGWRLRAYNQATHTRLLVKAFPAAVLKTQRREVSECSPHRGRRLGLFVVCSRRALRLGFSCPQRGHYELYSVVRRIQLYSPY